MPQQDKYNRSNFLTPELVDGFKEYDLITNTIRDFKFSRPMSTYRMKQQDIARPDLICIKAYGTVDAMSWWWILLYVNGIHDPWNDFEEGDIIKIPDRKDIEEFISFNRSI